MALTQPTWAQTSPPGAGTGDPDEAIDLWPGNAPGVPVKPPVETVTERSSNPALRDRAVTGIVRPRLALFRPARPNGAAMLVMPGGGYQRVVIDKEGYEIAPLLAARGITVFVLFYRLPGEGWADRSNVPLADAQRAMRLIRARAKDHGIDPARVGAMGFSAGGHLCADLATRFDQRVYAPVDGADTLSARPVLAAPIYPVISMTPPVAHAGSREMLLGRAPNMALERLHGPHHNVSTATPPCFLVHAEDDPTVPVENSLLFRQALKEKGVPVETHLFAEGGHGFGLRGAVGKPAAAWPGLFLAWAKARGFITTG
nr:alpha/beta hydrolase [Sphingobium sp.]